MKLTTKTTYGLRAVAMLAADKNRRPVAVSDISKKEGIPEQYLVQLLHHLKKEGIVKSIRGPQGGYVLAKKPEELSVYDIVKVLEGNVSVVSCLSKDKEGKCNRVDHCSTHDLWSRLNESIESALKGFSIRDLSGTE